MIRLSILLLVLLIGGCTYNNSNVDLIKSDTKATEAPAAEPQAPPARAPAPDVAVEEPKKVIDCQHGCVGANAGVKILSDNKSPEAAKVHKYFATIFSDNKTVYGEGEGTAAANSDITAPGGELIKTREFLYNGKSPKDNVFGLVVFTSKPVTDSEKKLYRNICRYWESSLNTKKELGIQDNVSVFSTYWPSSKIGGTSTDSCNNLYDYNYAYVNNVLNNLKIKQHGPMLLAIYSNNSEVRHVSLSLSSVNTDDIKRTFDTWKYDLNVTKDGWDKSFTITYFKEKLRYLLNTYGEKILEFKSNG